MRNLNESSKKPYLIWDKYQRKAAIIYCWHFSVSKTLERFPSNQFANVSFQLNMVFAWQVYRFYYLYITIYIFYILSNGVVALYCSFLCSCLKGDK